jgi:hypothetical protein
MWLAWLRTLAFNLLFIGGVIMIIAFLVHAAGFILLPPGALLAVAGARGLRRTALAG